LWIIVLALVARVTVFVRPRPFLQFASIDLLAIIEIILVVAGIVVIFTSPLLHQTFSKVRRSSAKTLLSYYVFCLISSVWSLNTDFTVFRSVEMIVVIMMIFLAMSHYEEFYNAERTYIILSLVTIIFCIIMHLKIRTFRLSLSLFHTNQYSAISAMAFVYCLGESLNNADKLRKRLLIIFAAIFAFFTLLGTSSTSNMAAFVGIIVVLFFARTSKIPLFFILVFGLILMYLSGNFVDIWRDILLPGKSDHDIITLRGRLYLWRSYAKLFWKQPLWGYGFAVVSRLGSKFGVFAATHTHNGLLEVILGTGLIGLFVVISWMIRLLIELIHTFKKKISGSLGFLGALTVGIVNNMGRSMIGAPFDAPSTMFLVLLGLFAFHVCDHERKRIRETL
jgi:O-antigen ligase